MTHKATPTTATSPMQRRISALKNCTMTTARPNDESHTWKEKLRERIEVEGQQMDEETSSDLKQIMDENNNQIEAQYPKDSFMYLFWRQQREAVAKKDLRGMRWHPLMIRWCLYLRHHSNKAYEVLA